MATVDFHDQLRRQLGFVQNSIRLYDEGHLEEAIRIATCLRVLFHTTKASTSVLTHLNAESCSMLSTAMAVQGRRDVFALIDMRGKVGIREPWRAHPKLDGAQHRRFLPFSEWWRQEAIINAGGINGGCATRRDLVLWAANKDGGVHVAEVLTSSYQGIIDGLGMAIVYTSTDQGTIPEDQQVKLPLENLHLASLRQVAYEVLASPDLSQLQRQVREVKSEETIGDPG
jgi:hypothetical protein